MYLTVSNGICICLQSLVIYTWVYFCPLLELFFCHKYILNQLFGNRVKNLYTDLGVDSCFMSVIYNMNLVMFTFTWNLFLLAICEH